MPLWVGSTLPTWASQQGGCIQALSTSKPDALGWIVPGGSILAPQLVQDKRPVCREPLKPVLHGGDASGELTEEPTNNSQGRDSKDLSEPRDVGSLRFIHGHE